MYQRLTLTLLLLLLTAHTAFSQSKVLQTVRVDDNFKIDGYFNEAEWQNAHPVSDFLQYNPVIGVAPRFKTEVRLLYSDEALYVAATMYDPAPDSIQMQLGGRDDDHLNIDQFLIGFDTYGNQQDAYVFGVSASGVQYDARMKDNTFNAVWESKTVVTETGWNAEFRIPYSAIRFPEIDRQQWGLQIVREIRRFREEVSWALEEKGAKNVQVNWGHISGISDIVPPVRLSLSPYVSTTLQHYPVLKNESPYSWGYNGGADLKYGINQSFTLDAILLPDFTQVQTDSYVKNLSAFETVYDENREFFKEGIDLFQKGDLFYSRRIGRAPVHMNSIADSLNTGEEISANPMRARLLNALKLSGRTSKGTGIGLFNAITGNTYAEFVSPTHDKRRVLTDPAGNYNIFVVDQTLRNNSSVYLINTNVARAKGYKGSNVTGAGSTLYNNSQMYQLVLHGAYSTPTGNGRTYISSSSDPGYSYEVRMAKVRGKFKFGFEQQYFSKYFDKNDMGLLHRRDITEREAELSYNFYEPFGKFISLSHDLEIDQQRHNTYDKTTQLEFQYTARGTFTNYLTMWLRADYMPVDAIDYYEPRSEGRFVKQPGYFYPRIEFSSDYRKPIALDGEFGYTFGLTDESGYNLSFRPLFRVNDNLLIRLSSEYAKNLNQKGFVARSGESIYFGNRDVDLFENFIRATYSFSPRLIASLWVRQYWLQAEYDRLFTLGNDGQLLNTDYVHNRPLDENFNSLNLDFDLAWEFSPGSFLTLAWKDALIKDENQIYDFSTNFRELMKEPQLNILSLRLLYYLDYHQIKKSFRGKQS